MIKELRAQLCALAEKTTRLDTVNNMLSSLYNSKRELWEETEQLEYMLKKEENDVQKLEKTSVSSVLFTLLGSKEQRLDKEKREAAEARLKYYSAKNQLDGINDEILALQKEAESLANCRNKYAEIFELIKKELGDSPEYAEKLCRLDSALGECESQLREIDEAISVGNAVILQTEAIDKELNSASNWGTWDVLGGGIVADVAKHSRLDSAQDKAAYLQTLLRRFHTELCDVHIYDDFGSVNVTGFLKFADYFFDGIVFDWAVLSKIKNSRNSVYDVRMQVTSALNKLCAVREMYIVRKEDIEAKLNALVSGQ